jgi:inner membrane protein
MTTPNHIAGGLVFTGTMLSFYNVNIFSNPYFMGVCVVASLLPDIDTPKTLPGKALFPFAVYLNRRFGHRTITHSIVFLFFIILLLVFFSRIFNINHNYTRIVIFAIISHLILDMLTIQGIPLFYPFRRNPCVLPADPAYRLSTGNPRSEIIVFTIFILLAFTMFPLFSQGFWTSYNRSFGTVAHCDRENTKSESWVLCEYCYVKNNIEYKGEGFILESNEKRLILFNRKEVFTIDTDNKDIKINYTKPKNSHIPKKIQELNFMDISLDSVNRILHNRICSGLIQSNFNVRYIDKGITYHSNFIKFSHNYNFKLLFVIDSTRNELFDKLSSINTKITKDSLEQLEKSSEYQKLKFRQLSLTYKISQSTDLYTKNKLQNDLIEISQKIKSFDLKSFQIDFVLLREREKILNDINKQRPLMFSGYLSYLII